MKIDKIAVEVNQLRKANLKLGIVSISKQPGEFVQFVYGVPGN